MTPLVVMIDGLHEAPKAWHENIYLPLVASDIEVRKYDRRDPRLVPSVLLHASTGRKIVIVAYSFGAEIAAELSKLKGVVGCVLIDGVHESKAKGPFEFHCPKAIAFTRMYIIGRAQGIAEKREHDNWLIDAGWFGHSRIVGMVAPRVVEWVKQVLS